jgi:hypothetical protein
MLDNYVWSQITELVLNPDIFLQLSALKDDSSDVAIQNALGAVKAQILVKEKEKEKTRIMFMRDAITEEEMSVGMAKINKELDILNKQVDEYAGLLTSNSRKLQSADMIKTMVAFIGQGIEDERQGIKTLSLREKRGIIDMLVKEIIIEFQGEDVVLTYVGIIDELIRKKIADNDAAATVAGGTNCCDLCSYHQKI